MLIVLVAAVGGVVYGLWPKPQEALGPYDQKVMVTMGGFNPNVIELPAGKPSTLWLVNPDSPYHIDGGGVHGFTVPDLGIDVRVKPRSNQLVEIPAAKPGEYSFYCDTCCGGKESPAMQGVLRIGGGA
ncbi:MAG: cupredoxin domain-containing protein [Dehalococcoidia bacterium]